MNYSEVDIANDTETLKVYNRPRFILGKPDGPMIRFYTLSLTENGNLTISSTAARTIPAAAFNATFTKLSDNKVGGIYIKTPSVHYAMEVKSPGNISIANVETGEFETRQVDCGEFLVSRQSGLVSVFTKEEFYQRFSYSNPLNENVPTLGRSESTDLSIR